MKRKVLVLRSKMLKHILLYIFFFLMPFMIIAQENINMIDTLNIDKDIITLEERISELIKKNPKIGQIQGLKQFHIFGLKYTELSKVDTTKANYLNHSFLSQLIPTFYIIRSTSFYSKERKYLDSSTLITDSLGKLVAIGDPRAIYIFNFAQGDIELAKRLFNKEYDFIFKLQAPFAGFYEIGIKGNKLTALESGFDGFVQHSWEEFMNDYFDKWLILKSMYQ